MLAWAGVVDPIPVFAAHLAAAGRTEKAPVAARTVTSASVARPGFFDVDPVPSWMQIPGIDIAKLEEKRDEDRRKRRGTAVNEDLLAYTEFTQLTQIILDDWNKFGPALGKEEVYRCLLR
jgi:hypothetical protein